MTIDQTGAPAAPQSRGKGLLITGVVLLVIGAVGIIVGIVLTANATSTVIDNSKIGSAQTAPAKIASQLDEGTTYAVYEATTGDGSSTTVQPADISVTGPSGSVVSVIKTSGSVTTTGEDNKAYVEVATFDPPTTGSYTIAVATNGSLVTVAPALSTAAKGIAWIVAVVLGALAAVIGVVLIIIGAARRSSSPKKQLEAPPGSAATNARSV